MESESTATVDKYDPLGEIQDALARQLDAVFAPVPIYFEAFPLAGDEEEPELTGDYIYVDIVPAGFMTQGPYHGEMSVLVDIALYKKGGGRRKYRELATELDLLFRPVFRFGDRAITVHNAEAKTVDAVLHYSFTLRFIPDRAIPEGWNGPLMDELVTTVEIAKE